MLRALGLRRRELWAWALYDWANSAFATTVMAAVLPVFYADVAAAPLPPPLRTAYWGYTAAVALGLTALLAPVLGAVADAQGTKKRFLALFAGLGIGATALLSAAGEEAWLYVSSVFVVANVGFAAANVFYDALLPSIARPHELNRVSAAGFALGYVGGGLLLALHLLWISQPQVVGLPDAAAAARLAFASVALWWALFSLPLLRWVPEPSAPSSAVRLRDPPASTPTTGLLRAGFGRLAATLREVRHRHRPAFLFLIAFWLYSDGIGTIMKMATIYGREVGIGAPDLLGALLLVQLVGVPGTVAFGALADRLGVKAGLYVALGAYTAIAVLGFFMAEAWHFWLLALGMGLVQGGAQALSRALYARLIPRERSAEFFAFYSVSAKFAGIFGPLMFGLIAQLTGNSRLGILALVAFFVGGIALLRRVRLGHPAVSTG